MNHSRISTILGVPLLALVLSGCASAPQTYARADPHTDFSKYHTYGFLAKPSTNKADYDSRETTCLKSAVSRELENRGLTRSEDPDLLVNFYIQTQDKVRSTTVPRPSGYYRYRDPFYEPWGGYGYDTHIEQYTEGTLSIDVVDAKHKKLVWEGSVIGRVTKAAIQNLEATIDSAVGLVLEKFPIEPLSKNR